MHLLPIDLYWTRRSKLAFMSAGNGKFISKTSPSSFLFLIDAYPSRVIATGACSSVRLERTPDKREVGSSSLPRPTRFGALLSDQYSL